MIDFLVDKYPGWASFVHGQSHVRRSGIAVVAFIWRKKRIPDKSACVEGSLNPLGHTRKFSGMTMTSRFFSVFWCAAFLLAAPVVQAKAGGMETRVAQVTGVADGDTFWIGEQKVRLDGVQAPELPHDVRDMARCPHAQRVKNADGAEICDVAVAGAARDALASLVKEQSVTLELNPQRERDRYGRLLAQVYVADQGGKKIWVQGELLRQGLVHVYPLSGQELKVGAMLEEEDKARRGKRGVWAQDAFATVTPETVGVRMGDYAFVEGAVMNAAKVRDRIYVNFGADWKSDFTLMIPQEDWKKFKKSGLDPLTWQGRRVRVRGYVYEQNGPMIMLTNPGQIELADDR